MKKSEIIINASTLEALKEILQDCKVQDAIRIRTGERGEEAL